MREEEFPTVVEICWEEIYDEMPFEELFDWMKNWGSHPYTQHFVAEEAGEIKGFITWTLYDRYGKQIMLEISAIAVKEEYQEKGIGEILIRESLEKVREFWTSQGLRIIMFIVETETEEENVGARNFYNKVLRHVHKRFIPNVWEKEGGKVFYFKDLK